MASKTRDSDDERPKSPRGKTPVARENQMIALAIDLAEKQMTEGTASAQVISHYLKLGSTREQKEQARIDGEIRLQEAKIEQMEQGSRLEELIGEALNAMRSYKSSDPELD